MAYVILGQSGKDTRKMELHVTVTVVKVETGCVTILEAPHFIRCTKSYRIFNIHLHMLGKNRKA